MKCKTPACDEPHAQRSLYCNTCLPRVEAERREKKLAWWRSYYRRVVRPRKGHKREYRPRA